MIEIDCSINHQLVTKLVEFNIFESQSDNIFARQVLITENLISKCILLIFIYKFVQYK